VIGPIVLGVMLPRIRPAKGRRVTVAVCSVAFSACSAVFPGPGPNEAGDVAVVASHVPLGPVPEPCPRWEQLVATLDEERHAAVRLAVLTADPVCNVSVRGDDKLRAASTIKLLALAGTLERRDRNAVELDDATIADLESMIRWSDNDAATRIIDRLEASGERFSSLGARWGVPGARHPGWGLSPVSANEMAHLVASIFLSELLSRESKELARYLLDLPDADWEAGWRVGVGFGTPQGWYRGSKVGALECENGFCMHGVGLVVAPDGTSYAMAMLSDSWPNEVEGAETLNGIGLIASDAMVRVEHG